MSTDSAYTYGLTHTKLMVVRINSQVTVNQPYYFEQDGEIAARRVISIEPAMVQVPMASYYGNIEDGSVINGYQYLDAVDYRFASVYLVSKSGKIQIENHPLMLFWRGAVRTNLPRSSRKLRCDLEVDPASSYIIFKKQLTSPTLPAIVALNVNLQ